ncbi:TPR Domain containing protein [Tritrichomonas foetus]|uniref:TPR Domain containing protein n=1 Tax=Tritrichomonas foetus TaxID=1144522 RepID=A0A1J4JFG7_9EUKA|nr:TPR Domain containing protein [Tritrichomonas foetus]|eukprot:OHS97856.1 TPR Domain containing protein [Tritrichomonas foetus]
MSQANASTTENPELPPAFPESKPVDLKVTVQSIEGFNFLTELGSHQLAVSILFPTHTSDVMSPLSPPAETVQLDFSETYAFQFYPQSTVNALLSNPLEFFLYICTPDMKKQTQVARFVFPFDQLFFNDSYTASIEGKVLPDGQAVLSPEGLKMNIECAWSTPIFDPDVQKNSLIATFNISSVNSPPLAMVNCSTQPNNPATHIFTYTLFSEMPDQQVLLLEDGKFQSTTPDGSDAFVNINATQKFFIKPDDLEKWKEAAETEQCISFCLKPELSPLLQPLGITQEMYSALFGVAEVPLSHFAKPGRSHLQITIPLLRDMNYSERQPGAPLLSPTGFPPEPAPDNSKKKTAGRKTTPSARGAAPAKGRVTSTPSSKKPRALNAKEKKMLAQLQTVMKFDNETDYFKESTTSLKLEIALSRPIIPRPATPASTKTPEEIVKPLPKMHDQRLADATEEFCRQLKIAIEKLNDCDMKSEEFKNLRHLIKEGLKPSIVEIVRQVFLSKTEENEDGTLKKLPPPKITPSFISELRTFLITNLNKTINTKYDLAFPHAPPLPTEMDVEHITNRIMKQSYHKTDDLEQLYLRRCELDPLNAKWPFEFALYYNDRKSPKALEYFAKAISIDYNFTAAILGFCSQLANSGNREDCVVLLNMLENRKPNDPTVTVCLSILYQLIESSKSDEFLGKISTMSANLPKSPNLIAASSLLEVHDTFMSEIMLTREQLQCQPSKDLLILLAKFTQQNGEYSRAQEYLKECLEADQEDLALWKMLGEYQYAAGERDKASVSFERMLALAEEPDPEVCLRLALIDILKGKYDKAYDLLMYTVQHMAIALAWTCLGVCCLRMEDFEEAEASLCQANEMDQWDATTWGYCAILCGKCDRRIEGEQALVLATKLKLRDWRLIQELIEIYDDISQGEETLLCLNELKNVKQEECHSSLEPDDAGHSQRDESGKEEEEEEEEAKDNDEDPMDGEIL